MVGRLSMIGRTETYENSDLQRSEVCTIDRTPCTSCLRKRLYGLRVPSSCLSQDTLNPSIHFLRSKVHLKQGRSLKGAHSDLSLVTA